MMKINLLNIDEGINELKFEHNSESLGIVADKELSEHFINPIKVMAIVNKMRAQYFLNVSLATVAQFNCDRCLESCDQKLHHEFKLVYSMESESIFGTNKDEFDFRVLAAETTVIDLTADIRESLLLQIPMKILCSEDCRGLCPQCGINLNVQTCNHHKFDSIDPRWDALRKLV